MPWECGRRDAGQKTASNENEKQINLFGTIGEICNSYTSCLGANSDNVIRSLKIKPSTIRHVRKSRFHSLYSISFTRLLLAPTTYTIYTNWGKRRWTWYCCCCWWFEVSWQFEMRHREWYPIRLRRNDPMAGVGVVTRTNRQRGDTNNNVWQELRPLAGPSIQAVVKLTMIIGIYVNWSFRA